MEKVELIKTSVFIAIIYFLLTSKMFVNNVLMSIPGAVQYDIPTEKGQLIGAFCMVVAFLLIYFTIRTKWI